MPMKIELHMILIALASFLFITNIQNLSAKELFSQSVIMAQESYFRCVIENSRAVWVKIPIMKEQLIKQNFPIPNAKDVVLGSILFCSDKKNALRKSMLRDFVINTDELISRMDKRIIKKVSGILK